MEAVFTSDSILKIAGAALSLLFLFVPYLRKHYDPLGSEVKASIMALLILGSAIVMAVGACTGVFQGLACTQQGIMGFFFGAVFNALLGNVGTFIVFKPIANAVFGEKDKEWAEARAGISAPKGMPGMSARGFLMPALVAALLATLLGFGGAKPVAASVDGAAAYGAGNGVSGVIVMIPVTAITTATTVETPKAWSAKDYSQYDIQYAVTATGTNTLTFSLQTNNFTYLLTSPWWVTATNVFTVTTINGNSSGIANVKAFGRWNYMKVDTANTVPVTVTVFAVATP